VGAAPEPSRNTMLLGGPRRGVAPCQGGPAAGRSAWQTGNHIKVARFHSNSNFGRNGRISANKNSTLPGLQQALLYSTLLYSTLLYSTLLYSTLLYSQLQAANMMWPGERREPSRRSRPGRGSSLPEV
jgi:hypothetical protein